MRTSSNGHNIWILPYFLFGFGTLHRKVLFFFSKMCLKILFTHAHFLNRTKGVILTSFLDQFFDLTEEIIIVIFKKKI